MHDSHDSTDRNATESVALHATPSGFSPPDRAPAVHCRDDTPITLNPIQAAFLACTERFSFYVGGIGAGKTTAGALRAIARAIEQPGSLGFIGAPTYPMLRDATQRTFFELLPESLPAIGGANGRGPEGPAHDDAGLKPEGNMAGGAAASAVPGVRRPFKAESARLAHGEGTPGKRCFNKTEGRLQLENGSEILFRSLDEPDRVRGLNLAWFWLDEAPLAGYYAWQILKGRLRHQGYAQATAGWATGTPHGRDGFWRDFEHQPRPHHALFRAATSANAAHLPTDYIADLGLTGALYEQEVLGLFTAFEGLVYAFTADQDGNVREHEAVARGLERPAHATDGLKPDDDDAGSVAGGAVRGDDEPSGSVPCAGPLGPRPPADACAGPLGPRPPAPPFARVIGGVDWGYTHPTAALVFGLDGDGRAWQLDEFYQRRAPLDAVVLPALCELTRRWGVTTWYGGPDEPEHLAALQLALLRAGLACRVLPATNAVRPGIQTITRLLARREDGTRGLYVAPRCVRTIAEYGMYQWEPERTERASALGAYAGPSGPRLESGAGGMTGEVSETPRKQYDDAMDATRYALHTALGQSLATDAWLELWLTRRRWRLA